ncbi:hypothetical protein [Brachybacterium sp. UNK5269]|uniref:hypothetical protein n=1 Tax=Brachybacterium sp. UNK5269 TaxID=3408576 RepID=UPI003BAE255D
MTRSSTTDGVRQEQIEVLQETTAGGPPAVGAARPAVELVGQDPARAGMPGPDAPPTGRRDP